MKIVLSTIGKFHTFDLARELNSRGALTKILTGYPSFKLVNEGLPKAFIQTFPWVQAPYMGFPWRDNLPNSVIKEWENLSATSFGHFVARNLPECDLYVGLSGSALPAGKKAHQRGARFICDRGSSHIRVQDQLMCSEYQLWGVSYAGVDPRVIDQEEAEYAESDCITVPSNFVYRSFVEQGISPNKVKILSYGVNLSRFHQVKKPISERFDILFVGAMSLRKGVQYLVQAYKNINHPAKSLTFVGAPSASLIEALRFRGLWPEDAIVLGHVPQEQLKNLMSRSHVLVLPSIEEGLAMVMAQAMACGCPVIASNHSGGEDLITDGLEGFIISIRDVPSLTDRLQKMIDQPKLRNEMSIKALEKVQKIGGWHNYGEQAMKIYSEVISA